MPKCSRCPIVRTCNKMGRVTLYYKGESGKEETMAVCPLIWAIDYLLEIAKKQGRGK